MNITNREDEKIDAPAPKAVGAPEKWLDTYTENGFIRIINPAWGEWAENEIARLTKKMERHMLIYNAEVETRETIDNLLEAKNAEIARLKEKLRLSELHSIAHDQGNAHVIAIRDTEIARLTKENEEMRKSKKKGPDFNPLSHKGMGF